MGRACITSSTTSFSAVATTTKSVAAVVAIRSAKGIADIPIEEQIGIATEITGHANKESEDFVKDEIYILLGHQQGQAPGRPHGIPGQARQD
ncbi:hypothetical protein PG994_003790 [Apiospora phragmitis]|uniref:Uncharacterized protein n=1 Tax=Apiospora phragmitis TaxID=2905665 RepID=A0ABR1W2Z7_9PEZI